MHSPRASLALAALLGAALAVPGAAQAPNPPNSVLLVARPGMQDPRFRETVVLVTQAPGAQTVGVILNRPTGAKLDTLMPGEAAAAHAEPLFYGGPVLPRSVVALFHAQQPPSAPAFHVLKGVYLSMHPAAIEPLLAGGSVFRLYAGFSGWLPRQLEGEMRQEAWYVVPAREEFLFRRDTSGMWAEMLEKARGARAQKRRAILGS